MIYGQKYNGLNSSNSGLSKVKAAMKVGTDGVILGAWTSVDNTSLVSLMLGTGTGLIALDACSAAVMLQLMLLRLMMMLIVMLNLILNQSPWKERLRIFHSDFNTFSKEHMQLYDLIVCNPPFFIDSLKTSDPQLAIARHNGSMNF